MPEGKYVIRYVMNQEPHTTMSYWIPLPPSGNPTESYIINEFQRRQLLPRQDGRSIKSLVVESIERVA